MKKKILVFITAAAMMAASMTGCGTKTETTTTNDSSLSQNNDSAEKNNADQNGEDSEAAENAEADQKSDDVSSSVSVTDERTFIVTLYAEYAPITCENFENLVSEGFYNGLSFHRVVEGFMAQGGDPLGNGTGGSEKTIKGEFISNGVDNKLSHTRGVISMARSMDPDSASSQFFICYNDGCKQLDGNYAAFGEVTQGMEVIDAFLAVPRSYNAGGEMAVPETPITIHDAVMIDPDENGNHRVQFTMNEFLK